METTFQDLGLSEATLRALSDKGFVHPTPIQIQAIPILLEGQYDVIGQAQTGTGKTAAFGLPIVEKIKPEGKLKALVLAPTRELALQVSEEIKSFDPRLSVLPVYGGASMTQQLKELKQGVDVVVGTPGRVMDHLRRKSLKIDALEFFVLDEADEMLNMGFVDDIETILKETNEDKQMLFFSATMPQKIMNLASSFMREFKTVSIAKKTLTSDAVTQYYHLVKPRQKASLLSFILEAEEEFYGLIFTNTKADADRLGLMLTEQGYPVEVLHGDISQGQREKILAKFRKRVARMLIATDVAARGIDVNDLTHVVNYSLPQDPEAYIHRIGRTGRAGKKGVAISLIPPGDTYKLRTIERLSKSKLEKRDVPSPKTIIEAKKQALHRQLTEAIASGQNEAHKALAQELMEAYDPAEVVAHLLKLQFGARFQESAYNQVETVKASRNDHHEAQAGTHRKSGSVNKVGRNSARLFVAMGKQDDMTPEKLVQFFQKSTQTYPRKISDIIIKDGFSYVTVPKEEAEFILRKTRRMKRNNKPIIEKAKPAS